MSSTTVRAGFAVLVFASVGSAALAQDASSLDDLSFIAGSWCADVEGEFVEEVWSEPRAGAMLGMFRWLRADGQPRVYEILSISEEDGEVLLRLRHFSATMIAWEERDAPIVLRREDGGNGRASFVNVAADGLPERYVFERSGENELRIDVLFREATGAAPIRLDLSRGPCG